MKINPLLCEPYGEMASVAVAAPDPELGNTGMLI